MSRSHRKERRERPEREMPPYEPTLEPQVDEVTAIRLKRAFPLEDYPGARYEDLVVTPSGRVLIKGGSLGDLPEPERPPLRLV